MIACFDVGYPEAKDSRDTTDSACIPAAVAACVTLKHWTDANSSDEIVIGIKKVEPYVPGEFYRRELPCILKTLEHFSELPKIAVVDSYVWLSPEGKKGLGAYLHEVLGGTTIVVGVAKSHFRLATHAIPVLRGESKHPLYITAEGMDQIEAANCVRQMHGCHRLPTALKRVDQLSRTNLEPS